ncbi:cyclopropane-fatty-acyl-phospholipid synthase [Sulfitobacter sp. F26204]|uniref:SAM-dependent methyltransferase n=1 Tax=Sulfitobacter sp. F26204 TaxID=2996014 RepID=UPI00225E42F4|nr:cyclopropane-fatty-acyl-phospholipid synthase family protein [Sulfitobacter sp. F26204]MCX7561141.1 cyclopropane-fatty-acyl-phospholipid synthase [Sulfitobacter sp. F26204]
MHMFTKRIKHDFLESCGRIQVGSLHLQTPEGDLYDFGAGSPVAEMQIYDWSVVTAVAARGDIGLGETYVAGLWDTPSISALTEVALRNVEHFQGYMYGGFWNNLKFRFVNRLLRANSLKGASRNIRAHYDVGNEFYQLWLDEGMTYSSALFTDADQDLFRGQNRKYDRILDRIDSAETVLEIGCGWGGFAERAVETGRQVTGLTISPSQKGYADARLDGRADIRLQDYRKCEGKFDSIVSIEMIEAVGQKYWPAYFGTLKARLANQGRAMVQAITVPNAYFDTYRSTSDYIRHYTFPGGMLLSNAMIAEQANSAGLRVVDTFAFGADYSRTCAIWNDRLNRMTDRITALGYDEQFLRNWRYYLGVCSASFATGQTDVVQVELAHA